MNVKVILLTLLVAASANAVEYTEKQAQLDALTNEIVNQDKKLSEILAQLKTCIDLLKYEKKQMNKSLTDTEFYAAYTNEVEHFAMDFVDTSKNKEDVLFNDSILGKGTALLKFYIIIYSQEEGVLQKLLHQWAILKNELTDTLSLEANE